jgi:hypothetical protein
LPANRRSFHATQHAWSIRGDGRDGDAGVRHRRSRFGATHYTHTHYAHPRYHHHYGEGRQIIVHSQAPVLVQPVSYAWGPVGAVGSVVGGTGQAVQSVFIGAGGIVGGVVGGVFGGVSALFGGPGYNYTPVNGYGGPFAAPFNAAGGVAAAPFQVVSGAFGGTPPAAAY